MNQNAITKGIPIRFFLPKLINMGKYVTAFVNRKNS